MSEGENWNKIVVERTSLDATVPTKGSDGAAGYDLYSSKSLTIYCGQRVLVPTGVKVELPRGYYGQIFSRSGLAYKSGVMLMAGVIDNDYRGEIGVLIFNSGDTPIEVIKGDRVAQMVLLQYGSHEVIEQNIGGTRRGAGGFGSTGQ